LAFGEERVQCAPEGHAARSRRFAQSLDLLLVRAESQTEHVGNDLFADVLALELIDEPDEDLVGHMRQRGADAVGGRELRDEDHRLSNDGVDQDLRVHATCAGQARQARPSVETLAKSRIYCRTPLDWGVKFSSPVPLNLAGTGSSTTDVRAPACRR